MKLYQILGPLLAVALVSSVSADADAWHKRRARGPAPAPAPQQAPELDATGAPIGLALALGGVLVVAGRRRRAVSDA